MYHRQLIRLTGADANLKAEDMTIRIATAATAGGAAASTETYKVTEWLGKDLPPHVAGFKNQPFFTHYMDPTENRANLDALAASYPELMSWVNMPEKTSGYQRKSQAIMSGSNAIGSAPDVQLGAAAARHHGRDHGRAARSPASRSPRPRGRAIRATVGRRSRPARPTSSWPSRTPAAPSLKTVDTGTSPEVINRTLTTAGTYTFEISGFQGDLGDFTFKVQPTSGSAAASAASAVVLTAKDWGQEGGNQVRAEFRSPGPDAEPAAERRGQRQADRGLPRHGRQRRPELDGQAGRRRDQRQAGGRRAA